MKIRQATEADIDNAIDLLKEFQEESLVVYGFEINFQTAQQLLKAYVATSLILEADDKIVGVISGTVNTYPLDGSKIYQEAVWFVSKPYRRHGLLLLKSLEDNCRENGIKHLVMVHLGNSIGEKVERFYIKQGFKGLEKHYIKTL
jgi:N-acetylglutamate synthase-like GNAT family acetyltransferase